MRALPRLLLRSIVPLGLTALAVIVAGCFDRGDEARVFVHGTAVVPLATTSPAASSTVATLAFTPTPFQSDLDPANLVGFTIPIEGACLPSRDEVMPNAPRAYRDGVHEGVDFYHGDVCTPIELGTPVLAMYDGVVIRADLDYVDITPGQVEALAAKTNAQGFSDPQTLDIYRGRQVWIDHGNGVVTRYAHLSAIARGIGVAVEVRAGQVIGAVGESGTPESVTAPGVEIHLHAEVRIDDGFLGEGLAPAEVRRLHERLFGPASGMEAEAPPPVATPAQEPPDEGDAGAEREAGAGDVAEDAESAQDAEPPTSADQDADGQADASGADSEGIATGGRAVDDEVLSEDTGE